MAEDIRVSIEKKAFIVGVAAALAGVIFRQVGFSMGIALGTLISLLNFRLLAKKVELAAAGQGYNPAVFFLGYIFRYLLMGLTLWVCINRGLTYFVGAACGLFAIRIAIYADSFIPKKGRTSKWIMQER